MAGDRFWSKVDRSGDCWLWMAGCGGNGYGVFWMEGRTRPAHRVSYQLENGPIPTGIVIDHKCHVPTCVNPAHLRAATHKQNLENLTVNRSNNRSGVRGVVWDKSKRKWQAQVMHEGRHHFGGRYDNIADAEAAVIELRNRLFTHNDADRECG